MQCLRERGASATVSALPAWQAVRLHRYSRLCYVRGWRTLARALWQVNLWLTGADISPSSDLGEGLVILHPFGVTVTGSAGRNLTIEGLGGMGGGMSLLDIGAGPGVPVLGDDVYIDRNARVCRTASQLRVCFPRSRGQSARSFGGTGNQSCIR